jgi:hypothetical protein
MAAYTAPVGVQALAAKCQWKWRAKLVLGGMRFEKMAGA